MRTVNLITWEHLLRDMSSQDDPPDPRTTYLVALDRGFSEADAIMASIFMNQSGERLVRALEHMARDPTAKSTHTFSRIMAFMRLSELATAPGAGADYRKEALELTKTSPVPFDHNRNVVISWIENVRYMYKDVRMNWLGFGTNLHWLMVSGQRDATKLALHFVARALSKDRMDDAELNIKKLMQHMSNGTVPHTHDDQREAARLFKAVPRRRSRLRQDA